MTQTKAQLIDGKAASIEFNTGNASTPTITFTGDENTGIYSPGADQLAISTSGSGRVFVDQAGNVSVGTSTNYVFDQIASGRPLVVAADSSSTTIGASTAALAIVNNNTTTSNTSQISFAALTGASANQYSSAIISAIHGARVNGQYPTGALVFSTSSATNSAPTEKLRITSDGKCGLGTSSPSNKFVVSNSGAEGVEFNVGVASNLNQTLYYNRSGAVYVSNSQSAADHRFEIQGAEKVRIDSSGRLLVGTSSTSAICTAVYQGSPGFPTGTGDIRLNLGQTPANGTYLGLLYFTTNSGSDVGAIIGGARDGGTWTSGSSHPTRLVFSTTADGASSPTERLRINNVGQTMVNSAGTASAPVISKVDDPNTGIFFPAGDTIAFSEGGSEAARITSAGNLLIGRTYDAQDANVFGIRIAPYGTTYFYAEDKAAISLVRNTGADGGNILEFRRGSGSPIVGRVTVTTTSTSYVTSSDYRLKENVIPVTDGITRLQQLKPSRFNFIADPDTTVDGFVAHEVQDIVPEAISGEKDAVDDEGNPVYQGIDQSKLVPLLTAALQEAVAKIESLEARLTAAGI